MSDQWRGPGWWAASDGRWYPPSARDAPADDEDRAESRWARRTGWVAEAVPGEESPGGELHLGIAAGTSILDAASGSDVAVEIDTADPVSEALEVIDLRSRYRQKVVSTEDSPVVNIAPADRRVPAPVDDTETEPEPELEPDVEPVAGREPLTEPEPGPVDTAATAPGGRWSGPILLITATALAVLSGVFGALWIRERDTSDELRAQLAEVETVDETAETRARELADEVRTLEIRNEQLSRQLQEISALVAPVPEGRLSTIAIPFAPAFVDEVRGRVIAIDASGQYVVSGGDLDGQISDSGVVTGTPTGLFAARELAFVSTDAGQIEVLSLVGDEDGLPIASGNVEALVQDNTAFWAYDPSAGELRRYRQNGRLTTTVAVPTVVRDLTVGAGAVWTLGDDGLVYRANTADFTVSPLAAGQDVVSITAGPDALWALSAADGSLRRLDAVSGEVLVTVPVGRDPVDAIYSGNSVWVALRSGSTLIEVDTRTSAVVSRTTLPAEPIELTPGETGVLVTLDGDVPLVRVASASGGEG